MKKTLLVLLCVFILNGISTLSAQTEKKIEKKIEKEIEVEEVNGKTTVTVTEKEGDKVTKKVYSGDEAKEYLESQPQGNAIFISDDENSGSENVFIMKMDGDEDAHYNWVSENEVSKRDEELEALRNEVDQLSKEEITARLDKILEEKEEVEVHVVKIQKGGENVSWTEDEMNVEVEEKDGVMIITKTVGDTKTIEEIVIDEDNKQKQVYVIKTDSDNGGKSKANAISEDLEVNVIPLKGNAGLNIELVLKTDEMADVKVSDSVGKEIYSRSVKGIDTHQLEVKIKNPSGTYLVEVRQGNKKLKIKTDLK